MSFEQQKINFADSLKKMDQKYFGMCKTAT